MQPGVRRVRGGGRAGALGIAVGVFAGAAVVASLEAVRRLRPPAAAASPPRSRLPERPGWPPFPVVSSARAIPAHAGAVHAVAFAPNGQRFVTAGADETARVWDARTDRPLHVLRGHTAPVLAAYVGSDGRVVVTAGDRTLRVWSLPDGKPLQSFELEAELVWSVAVSPGGQTLVAGGSDGKAEVWDIAGGRLASLAHGGARVLAASFTPDGSRLVTGGDDATVKIWDVADWKLRRTLAGHAGAVGVLAVAPDGQTLASGGDDGTVRLWRIDAEVLATTLPARAESMGALAFSRDGAMLVGGGRGPALYVWTMPEGTLRQSAPLEASRGGTLGAAFSPDGTALLTAHGDGSVARWRLARSGSHVPVPRQIVVSTRVPGAERTEQRTYEEAMRLLEASAPGPAAIAEAESRLNDLRKESPRSALAHAGLARVSLLRGDAAGARVEADAARRLAPDAALPLVVSAQLAAHEGEWEEAAALLQGVLGRPIDRVDASAALGLLAEAYEQMGDVEAADEARRIRVDVVPDAVGPKVDYARFLARRGDADAAAATAQRAVALAPGEAAPRRALGDAYCVKGEHLLWDEGDVDGAVRAFDAAAAADKDDPCAAFGLGACEQFVGATRDDPARIDEARRWYARAASLDRRGRVGELAMRAARDLDR
jgi:tetratricopeptide (TPR) repeat protein